MTPPALKLLIVAAVGFATAVPAPAREPRRGAEPGFRAFKFDKQFGREESGVREAFSAVVAPVARSMVRVRAGGHSVAFGVAAHGDGYIVTKSSEVDGSKSLEVEFHGGLKLPARVLDRLDAYDLALLKIEASGLVPVKWSEQPPPAPGSFLAAPSPAGEAVAIGVASVGARHLYKPPQGFLGVRLKSQPAVIEGVIEGGAAEKAGLKKDDQLVAIDGVKVSSADDLNREVSRHDSGEEIVVKYGRNGEEHEARIPLQQGSLGVRFKSGPAVIERVYEGGAAEKAGIQKDDEVVAIDDVAVKSTDDLIREVSRHRPGEEIVVKYKREGEEHEARSTLADRREFMAQLIRGHDPMELMHGRLSNHRMGFFNVFQHDLVLEPEECGGPLVNLDGEVVGLDIARAGRVDSLAIPAADMKALLANVTSGTFSLPDLGALRDELKKADLVLARAQEMRKDAERALDTAKRLIDTIPPPKKDEQPVKMMPPVMP